MESETNKRGIKKSKIHQSQSGRRRGGDQSPIPKGENTPHTCLQSSLVSANSSMMMMKMIRSDTQVRRATVESCLSKIIRIEISIRCRRPSHSRTHCSQARKQTWRSAESHHHTPHHYHNKHCLLPDLV